jgi:type II secretory pathway pseudopilin PulG
VNTGRATTRPGFTLLESNIALAMIGAVAGACLQVRAQSLAGRQRLTARQTTDRGIDTILRLAQHGLLEAGESEKDEENKLTRTTWTGDYLGEPFTCERKRTQLANPIDLTGDESAPTTITLWRWSVEYRNETAELLTPLRVNR